MEITYSDAKKLHSALFAAEEFSRHREMWLRIQAKQIPFLGELGQTDQLIKKDRGIVDMTAWRSNLILQAVWQMAAFRRLYNGLTLM